MRIPQNDVTLGNSNTKNLNLQDSSEINSSYRSNPSFESLEKHNIFHQLSEIFPYENQLKLIKILDECKWSMEEAVLRLIDQSNHPESNDSISNNVPHFDGEMKARSYSPRPSKRFVTVSLPSGFLEAPRVRTVLVPPLPHLAFDYQEYKVYYNRKGRSLDLNVKLIDRTVRVYGLLSSPDGGKGLSELAGVEVGDILYGINHQYFNTDVTLKDITTILSQCGCYVCLHFIRFHPDSMSIVVNGQIRRAGQLRKIHPCALSLIDQGVLRVDEIESFCENMSRLKSRIFSWSSGIITSRQKIADLQAVAQGEVFDSYSRDDPHQRSSKYEKLTKRRHSSHFSGSSNMSKYSQPNLSSDSIASDITKNWYRDIDLMTVNIQPALCIRIMDNRFVGDHVEYRIWVEDISTGLEWFVRRRFKQFYQLREKLVSLWPRFAQISFPSKTTIASVGSTADIVQERQPILERFLRSIYQIIVTEPLLHPLTREIYLILYNFLDIMDYMSGIESLVSLQSLAHGAHMNRLLFLTQDITVEPSQLLKTHDSDQSDPLLYTRRFIEIYIHSVLQLSTFSTRIIDKFINNFQHQCSEYLSQNNRHDHTSSSMSKDFKDKKLGNLSEFINDIQEVLIVGMKDDILELIEFLIHGNIQGRYSYHHPPPPPPTSTPPSSTLTYSESTMNNNQPDEIILEIIDGIRLRNDIIESLSRIAIRRQIEKEVYIPCSFYLHNVIKQSFQPEEKEFILKCSRLYSQPQTFYGIPPRNLSPSSWEDVVNSLSRLRNQYIPFDKLQILVSSAKLIPITYSKEHQVSTTTSGSDEIDSNNSNTSTSSKSLGADDLLPIFIYCLVRSRLSSFLLIISQELDTLCDTDDRVSEIGYYLATLQAAVYHIMVIDERVGDKIS